MKNAFLILLLLGSTVLYGQDLKLYNYSNLQPVSKAKVYQRSNRSYFLESDANGIVNVSNFDSTELIVVEHPFFHSRDVNLETIKYFNYKISLIENATDIDEMVVSANKFSEKKRNVIQKIQVLRASEIQNMNQTSTADLLAQSGNVMVQKSQLGGGSPIIRGFETNRVLMVVDGVRMNNAIYRGGHLQNVVTLDNAIMDRVELAFGAGSVVYGSDALGGVMHFYTKNPELSSNDKTLVKANAYSRYFSAAAGTGIHADVMVAKKKLGSLSSVTYSDFGDLKQGSNRSTRYPDFGKRPWSVQRIEGMDSVVPNSNQNIQVGSAYQQYDFLQKFLYKQSDFVEHVANIQYSTSSDVPRYDRLTQTSSNGDPKYGEWYYGPQKRFLGSYQLKLSRKNKLYDRSNVILAYQNIEESRITRRFNKTDKNHRVEQLDIYSLNVDFEKKLPKNQLRYGIETYLNKVNSSAFQQDILSNEKSKLSTRYPDGGSSMTGMAVYATQVWKLSKKSKDRFVLSDGIRLSKVDLNARFDDKTFFPFLQSEISQSNTALNGNLGLIFNPNDAWRMTANLSTGFRAPNVDDLSKVFDSQPGTVIVPNSKLKPEYSYNAELGVSRTFYDKLTVSALGYYTHLTNVINVRPSEFNGEDSILYDGTLSQVRQALNSDLAYVTGLEIGVKGEFNDYLSIFSTLNYTQGKIVADTVTTPLDHVAPVFGRVGLSGTYKKIKSELFVNYSAAKKLKDYNINGEDNISFATADGIPAWYTINLRVNYQFAPWIGMQVACENILDQNYRVFASNISSPGRNFILTLRASF
ncbi:MAG: hemoglobin/transferrin/lactoferrin receptor protein [Lentimonas sp.]|jgi:hemoglobin/transferrin/lactoferrin receptor protein